MHNVWVFLHFFTHTTYKDVDIRADLRMRQGLRLRDEYVSQWVQLSCNYYISKCFFADYPFALNVLFIFLILLFLTLKGVNHASEIILKSRLHGDLGLR